MLHSDVGSSGSGGGRYDIDIYDIMMIINTIVYIRNYQVYYCMRRFNRVYGYSIPFLKLILEKIKDKNGSIGCKVKNIIWY